MKSLVVLAVFGGSYMAVGAVQTLEVEYATEADAREAEVTVSALPEGKRLAFTERWDDSNPRHLDMAKAMEPLGVKATFYFNGGRGEKFTSIMRELVRRGHSIGNHTMTHRHQPCLLPFPQFQDILECRIDLECASQSPVIAYTTPHGEYSMMTDDEARVRVGRSLLNAGLLSSPEGNQKVCRTYSLRPDEWFGSHYFCANDSKPDIKAFENGLRAATNAMMAADSPFGRHVTLGTHTWQTDEGLAQLRGMLTPLARMEDVWLVNENEWTASRRLSFDTRVSCVRRDGVRVTYAVERPEPRDIGAEMEPWFRFTRRPVSTRLSKLATECRVPTVFKRLEKGVLKAEPDLGRFSLELVNDTPCAWPSVRVTLRLPSVYEPGVQTVSVGSLAAGAKRCLTFEASTKASENLLDGDFYAAAQIDLVADGHTERRWAEVLVSRPGKERPMPRDTIVSIGPIAPEFCPTAEVLADLSKPSSALIPLGGEVWRQGLGKGTTNARYLTMARPQQMPKDPKGCPAIWVCDFDVDTHAHGNEWLLTGRIYGYSTKRELYLNGRRLGEFGMSDVARPLELRNGRNRLVCKFAYIAGESFNHEIMIVAQKDGSEVRYCQVPRFR